MTKYKYKKQQHKLRFIFKLYYSFCKTEISISQIKNNIELCLKATKLKHN